MRKLFPQTMKPLKWGIKVWAQCGVSEMLCNFTVNIGKELDTSREYGKI